MRSREFYWIRIPYPFIAADVCRTMFISNNKKYKCCCGTKEKTYIHSEPSSLKRDGYKMVSISSTDLLFDVVILKLYNSKVFDRRHPSRKWKYLYSGRIIYQNTNIIQTDGIKQFCSPSFNIWITIAFPGMVSQRNICILKCIHPKKSIYLGIYFRYCTKGNHIFYFYNTK